MKRFKKVHRKLMMQRTEKGWIHRKEYLPLRKFIRCLFKSQFERIESTGFEPCKKARKIARGREAKQSDE